MPHNKLKNSLNLAGYDDIFGSTVAASNGESVATVPLTELHPPEFHPFQVNDDGEMQRLAESIKQYGVRIPGIVRPRAQGGYELLCGNRRKRGCELAGVSTMPVIIRSLDDNTANLIMVEDNLQQRKEVLPSERAWAYKVMMEALNHNGVKGDAYSYEVMVERTGVSKNQLFRYIRLTGLILDLSDMVDTKKLAFNPAVELSYLSVKEQKAVAETMAAYEVKPSHSQAKRLKKLKQEEMLTNDIISQVLSEEKKPTKSKADENGLDESVKYRNFFPVSYSAKQMDDIIISLLIEWKAGAA